MTQCGNKKWRKNQKDKKKREKEKFQLIIKRKTIK
jgi:hypothetical protein